MIHFFIPVVTNGMTTVFSPERTRKKKSAWLMIPPVSTSQGWVFLARSLVPEFITGKSRKTGLGVEV